MRSHYDLVRNVDSAPLTICDPVDRPLGDPGPLGKRGVASVNRRDVRLEIHPDSFIGSKPDCPDKTVRKLYSVKSGYSNGMNYRQDMTDEQIAQAVLADMFPSGTRSAPARQIGVNPKTFGRWCEGGSIKSADMPRLHGIAGFYKAFAAFRGDTRPQIDPVAREALIRLAAALGPSKLKELTFEVENLASIVGPDKALLAIERLVASMRDASESSESIEEMKSGQ
jgi:hypothetical protein